MVQREQSSPVRFRALLTRVILTSIVAIASVAGVFSQNVNAATAERFYVEETGQVFGEPFLSAWAGENGIDLFGLPVTNAVKIDGRRGQFFEFGVLREDDEDGETVFTRIKTGARVLDLLMETAASLNQQNALPAVAFQEVKAKPDDEETSYDTTSKHTISGRFLEFYDENGGMERFGRPISEAYTTGGIRMQWFEYARFEAPKVGGEVTLAPVGRELAKLRGHDIRKKQQGTLKPFVVTDFLPFRGDGTVPEATTPFAPSRIVIPKIGIDAFVEQVGIVGGVMGTPVDAWNVGWYPAISSPGDRSNVVMAGHRDWWGIGPTVFWSLGSLVPGDRIYVIGPDGKGATYEVTEVYYVDAYADATAVLASRGYEELTLITCGGTFNGTEYDSRQFVRAVRI